MDNLLTDDEAAALVMALMETRGAVGATEDEMRLVIVWANEARASYHLLNLVLSGRIQIDVRGDDVIFHK